MTFRKQKAWARTRAMTLVEVVTAIAIMAFVFGSLIVAYTQAGRRAEWSGYSLAAQALAIQQIEQARSAIWDYGLNKNELTNLNLTAWSYNTTTRKGSGYSRGMLDMPIIGTNATWATNFVIVQTINLNGVTNPPVQVQMVQVNTVWPFPRGGSNAYFTNTVVSYYAPDNRDPSTL